MKTISDIKKEINQITQIYNSFNKANKDANKDRGEVKFKRECILILEQLSEDTIKDQLIKEPTNKHLLYILS